VVDHSVLVEVVALVVSVRVLNFLTGIVVVVALPQGQGIDRLVVHVRVKIVELVTVVDDRVDHLLGDLSFVLRLFVLRHLIVVLATFFLLLVGHLGELRPQGFLKLVAQDIWRWLLLGEMVPGDLLDDVAGEEPRHLVFVFGFKFL